MANIYFRGPHGACVLAAHVYFYGFGLVCLIHDVLDVVAHHVEGRIGHRLGYFFRVVDKDKPIFAVAAGFWEDKVSILGLYVDYHVDGVVSEYADGLRCKLVRENVSFCEACLLWEQIFWLKFC